LVWLRPRAFKLLLVFPFLGLKKRASGVLGLIAGVYIGSAVVLALHMPIAVGDWTWQTTLLLVVLLGVSVAGRADANRAGSLRTVLFRPTAPMPAPSDGHVAAIPRVPFTNRLSGVTELIQKQFRNALITSVLVIALLVAMGSLPWPRNHSAW